MVVGRRNGVHAVRSQNQVLLLMVCRVKQERGVLAAAAGHSIGSAIAQAVCSCRSSSASPRSSSSSGIVHDQRLMTVAVAVVVVLAARLGFGRDRIPGGAELLLLAAAAATPMSFTAARSFALHRG